MNHTIKYVYVCREWIIFYASLSFNVLLRCIVISIHVSELCKFRRRWMDTEYLLGEHPVRLQVKMSLDGDRIFVGSALDGDSICGVSVPTEYLLDQRKLRCRWPETEYIRGQRSVTFHRYTSRMFLDSLA